MTKALLVEYQYAGVGRHSREADRTQSGYNVSDNYNKFERQTARPGQLQWTGPRPITEPAQAATPGTGQGP